jgi:hypothetical protein
VSNPEKDHEILANLQLEGFLKTHDDSDIFWNCFHDSYNMNPKQINGKVYVLSIIAERFTYEEIMNKLKVIKYIYFLNIIAIIFTYFTTIRFLLIQLMQQENFPKLMDLDVLYWKSHSSLV